MEEKKNTVKLTNVFTGENKEIPLKQWKKMLKKMNIREISNEELLTKK